MAAKLCSLLLGLAYLLFGICGLFPGFLHLPADQLRFYDMHIIGHWGFVFGWMPANLIHSIVYIILGAGGVLACASLTTATRYCQGIFAVALLFTIVGFLPGGISYMWGLMPLFGWNIMFNTVAAILAYYYGWVYPLDFGGAEPASEMM